jgi:adenylate kinase family enzyme
LATLAEPPWPAILLVGPTGAGKTPLGDEIEKRGLQGWPCVHFDFGANLRRAAQGGAVEFGLTGPETERTRDSLRSGALFESGDLPMIAKILRRFVETRRLGPGDRLVLNGLPRHRDQAEALARLLAVERVISLEAAAPVIVDRIGRDPGRDRAGRPDDDIAAIAGRLETFRRRTAPLLEFYLDRGVPVTAVQVTATMTAPDMYAELDRRLQSGGL